MGAPGCIYGLTLPKERGRGELPRFVGPPRKMLPKTDADTGISGPFFRCCWFLRGVLSHQQGFHPFDPGRERIAGKEQVDFRTVAVGYQLVRDRDMALQQVRAAR